MEHVQGSISRHSAAFSKEVSVRILPLYKGSGRSNIQQQRRHRQYGIPRREPWVPGTRISSPWSVIHQVRLCRIHARSQPNPILEYREAIRVGRRLMPEGVVGGWKLAVANFFLL